MRAPAWLSISCGPEIRSAMERRFSPIAHGFALLQTPMNLSHYKPADPDLDCGDRQTGLKACGKALPPDHQTPRLLLKPGQGPLRLAPGDAFSIASSWRGSISSAAT